MRPIDPVSACHGFGSHLDDPGLSGGGGGGGGGESTGGGGGAGGWGGGGDSIKGAGMLVVSLRVVSLGFWSHLGCFGLNAIIFSHKRLIQACS